MLFAIWLICLFISLLLLLIGSTLCCEVDLGFCESCARSLDLAEYFVGLSSILSWTRSLMTLLKGFGDVCPSNY